MLKIAFADVLINEVLYDPAGSDGGNEWVELCNSGSEIVDISGWTLEAAGTNFSEIYTVAAGVTLNPGQHLVVGPGVGRGSFSSNLQNGGSSTDGLRLVGGALVQDTVLYDSNNINSLLDDRNSRSGPFAPDVADGNSLSRSPDCAEVNNHGGDFVETETLTPGSPNVTNGGGGPQSCDNSYQVVINEIMPNPAGTDGGNEWVELFNTSEDDLDVSGWVLQAGNADFSNKATIAEGTILPAGGYFIIGEADVSTSGIAADLTASLSLGNGTSSIDGVRLLDCESNVLDTILYGDSSTVEEGWTDDQGSNPTSFAPEPSEGQSLGRIPNGNDTNNSASDIVSLSFASPAGPNDAESLCDGQYSVVINEFLPNPDSDETSEDTGREWVELYNTSSSEVDLSGWSIEWGTSSFGSSYSIPQGKSIAPGGHFLIGGEYVDAVDAVVPLTADLKMGAAGSNADALRLLHCGPGVSDVVVYGPSEDGVSENTDEWTNESGAIVLSSAPKPSAGQSIARRADGVDTNDNGADFIASYDPTPGMSNPEVICESSSSLKINEIYPNPDGTDGGQEWIELINTGADVVRLDGWSVEVASSSWSEKHTFSSNTEIQPGEIALVGDSDLPAEVIDVSVSGSLGLGNASSSLDGVRIVDCYGETTDTLLYGPQGADPTAEDLFDDLGLQSYVLMSDSGKTIGRFPDGADTDDSGVDFMTNMEPTPGQPNQQGTSAPGTPTPPKDGCSKSTSPDANGEPSKCSTVTSATQYWLMIVGLVAIRRRS